MRPEEAQSLADAWPVSGSLREACSAAGLKAKSDRAQYRYRREAEKMLNILLPPHDSDRSTDRLIECPSTLNLRKARKHKSFVITSCANNSPIVKPFFTVLEDFCSKRGSQLLIIPLRYKNPSAVNRSKDYKWAGAIHKYALLDDLHVSRSLVISGLRLQATAVNPLSGLHPNSGHKSAIYGHPQLAMEMVAAPKTSLAKMMHTTGAINRPRYSASKAGGKAKFNHSLSALYVRLVGKHFHTLQLMWDGTGFYFLNEYWINAGTDKQSIAALLPGDAHVAQEDKGTTKARKRVKAFLNPEYMVWNDVYDHQSQSHHNTTLGRIRLALKGKLSVEDEIKLTAKYILENGGNDLIVESNHHDHLVQWLNRFDPRQDPYNAKYYFWLMGQLTQHDVPALQIALRACNVDARFLSPNTEHLINGIDVSQHGHRGPNGSRGSARSIAKTTAKTFIGHSHSPKIEKGCWQIGTSTKSPGYSKGLSSWAIADGIIYPNGKRAILFYINNKTLVDYHE